MGSIQILVAFEVSNLGLLAEIKHDRQGLPPNTVLSEKGASNSWIVSKRILNGDLMTTNNEIYFDCETDLTHISHRYSSPEKRQEAVRLEIEKRKKGIYWYLLIPDKANIISKPDQMSDLEIITPLSSGND